ncbi:MAG: hypothetical protein IJ071_03560 [Ruminococcus sp.]|nr:hypothetical protein [Ruminococcus sp.]
MSDLINDRRYASDGVPVRVNRIFDSCSDRDCLSSLPVTLSEGPLPENINILRSRCAQVDSVCISVEPVPFDRGFYQIDLSFTFSLELLGYERSCSAPVTLSGTAYATKSCILYGSESSARIFSSADSSSTESRDCCRRDDLPVANVSVLEPIVLETKIASLCPAEGPGLPEQRGVLVTLGLFSVVELTRPAAVMVPALRYSIPRKESCCDTETPCEIFQRLKFPEEEFDPLTIERSEQMDELPPEGLS